MKKWPVPRATRLICLHVSSSQQPRLRLHSLIAIGKYSPAFTQGMNKETLAIPGTVYLLFGVFRGQFTYIPQKLFRGQFTYFPPVYLYPTGLNGFLRQTKEFIASAIYSAKR
jgi:hypothetical protein